MIPVPPGVRVLIATRPVDFRKGADSLAALAKETLAQDPFSGAVLVFRSRRADRIKVLVWDGSGLVLIWKYLASYCIFSDRMRGPCGDGDLGCRGAVDEPVPSAAMLDRWI